MSSLSKHLATGQRKVYYSIEDQFEARGSYFVDAEMSYTAAGPNGLWICEYTFDNTPVVIGLIPWDNLSRMVVDQTKEIAYIVPVDYEAAVQNADANFKLNRRSFTHAMSDNGDMSISVPFDLLSNEVLAYIAERIPTEIREEKLSEKEERHGRWMTFVYIIIFILIGGGLLMKFLNLFS